MVTTRKSLIGLMAFFVLATTSFSQDIHDAAMNGRYEMIKALLKENPELVNTRDGKGATPLHWAAKGEHLEIIILLIDRGADVNLSDLNGDTPLHWAAQFGCEKSTELLIEKGSSINQKNVWGWTPLFWAIRRSQFMTTELLMKKNADLYVRNNQGMTAFEWISSPRLYDKKMIDFLIDNGYKVSAENKYTENMLHNAASQGHRSFVSHLIKKGVNIKSRNENNGTFLHSAAAGGLLDYVEMMIKRGADANDKNRYGLTPLHLASAKGHKSVVEFLINNNTKVNAKSILGKTAFHYAKENNHQEVVNFLISKGANQHPPQFPILRDDYLGQKLPGMEPELFACGIISSPGYEHTTIAFSPDGNEVYWATEYEGLSGSNILFMKLEDNRWSPPQIAPFSSEQWDIIPLFSPDGQRLYFTSWRPLKEAKRGNIWYVERKGADWSEPSPLSLDINSDQTEEGGSVSESGNLYFASDREEGRGEKDIYCSRFKNGRYQKPENLGDSINTGHYESFPYVSPDESYIIFESGRPGGLGDTDFYISFHEKDGTWTQAKNMGKAINTAGVERFVSVSPDGRFIFFGSDRNGNFDLYWVDARIIDKLR